jgi:dTDP-4-amino-4,6-dideoxygalactose transaminase
MSTQSVPSHAGWSEEAIPQLDLRAQFAALMDEICSAMDDVLASQQFILGEQGAALEQEIARLCGAGHAVGLASGTDALIFALRACGVGAGDEVLLPPFTFVATGSAVSALGARPVFVDIDPETFNLDPKGLERRITPKTRAIIAVHLYGLPADMEPILSLARAHKLPVIEDAAQAIGARYKGRPVGSLGDAGCLSFYPTKNLGAYGDGGMLVTNSAEIAERLRPLRNHGQTGKYVSREPGLNSRLDELQAAVLRVKLRHLSEWQKARQLHAAEYNKLLAGIPGVITPRVPEGYEHVFHQFTIRIPRRDGVQKFLTERMIGSAVYYPVPLHLQPLYASLGHKPGDFPHAERAAQEVLSLPMYPELRAEQLQRVATALAEAVKA